MSLRLLVIDDDNEFREQILAKIRQRWPDSRVTEHQTAGKSSLPEGFIAAGFDLVVLAASVGLQWLEEIKSRPGFPPVVFVAEHGSEELAVAAIKGGASDYLSGPDIDPHALQRAVQGAVLERKRQRVLEQRSGSLDDVYRFGQVVIRGQRFVRKLASGPFASVFLAESERLGEMVVLKVLRQVPDVGESRNTFERFIQEYEVISGIEHPNVVRIHDLGVADDHAYIAMEYFPLGSLREHMQEKLPEQKVLDCIRQITLALQTIHAEGVLHRDLKPGNVMLREDGSFALIDFGLAKELAVKTEITGRGEIFGTPYYISPEQGHGKKVDERSDLYSLGVVFYELLTTKKPFRADAPMAVIYLHGNADVPRLPPELAGFQPVIDRLLAKQPGQRFQSAMELLQALDELSGGGQ
jgi:DNA-binding response OmpR family regulator